MAAKHLAIGLASLAVVAAAAIGVAQAPAGNAAPAPAAQTAPPAAAPKPAPPVSASAAAPAPGAVPFVATLDGATTMPLATVAPEQADMHELMEAMKPAHRNASDPNPEVALRAAKEVERLSIAGTHAKVRIPENEYLKLLADLYWKNQDLQKVLAAKAPPEEVLKAYQAQNAACNACHKVYRKKKG